ncbi:MAG: phytase [Lysobacter sp.]|nr:phytase [Lysobacter sp.]
MSNPAVMCKRLLIALWCLALVAGCTTAPAPRDLESPVAAAPRGISDTVVVTESYISEADATDELDSLVVWPNEHGGAWIIGTAKATHQLVVFDADSGERLREVGRKGSALGEFNRPNGVAVFADILFVVERDNHRVQMLSLPTFAPLGSFGETELRSPYGLWLHEVAPGVLETYVTDSFMEGAKFDVVPPFAQLDQRVRRYRVQLDDDAKPMVASLGSFGETAPEAALRMVESIGGDPANDRLLIAEEDTRVGATLREYDLAGRYRQRSLPTALFRGEAEGVVLWSCSVDEGFWIAADQTNPLTTFHVFDRAELVYRGSFTGGTTMHTDGIALHAATTPRFPNGALFAVHDDKAVTAFDLREIARALKLSGDCVH